VIHNNVRGWGEFESGIDDMFDQRLSTGLMQALWRTSISCECRGPPARITMETFHDFGSLPLGGATILLLPGAACAGRICASSIAICGRHARIMASLHGTAQQVPLPMTLRPIFFQRFDVVVDPASLPAPRSRGGGTREWDVLLRQPNREIPRRRDRRGRVTWSGAVNCVVFRPAAT